MAKSTRNVKSDAFHQLLKSYQELVDQNAPAHPTTPRRSIEDEIIRERKLRNDNAELDIRLKRKTLNILFIFLGLETVLVFYFTYLQATGDHHFHLDEWSFKLVVSATLTQITAMLFVAVRYLFPKSKR
jgi:hypothetical protein